jgi:heptosyltransferase-2
MAERFLIVRVAALGDNAMASTLMSRIRAEHPGAHVTWLCGRAAAPLVELFGADSVITVDERRLLRGAGPAQLAELARVWGALLGSRFDRVVLLHADARYLALVAPTWPARLRRARRGELIASRFLGDEMARLLDEPTRIGPVERRFPMVDVRGALGVGARGPRGRRVALVPGGTRNVLRVDTLRRWPLERYRQLAEQLIAEGCEVVLIGDAGDVEAGKAFAPLQVENRIGTLSLPDTLRTLAGVDVLVSHDTGPMHFARLVRTPAVALFGPTDPRQFIGDDESVTVLWGGARLPCRPCYDGLTYARCGNNLCMQDIPVGQVRDAVLGRLDSRRRASTAGERQPADPSLRSG